MKHSSIDWLMEQIEKSSKEGDIDFLLWNLKQNLLVQAKAIHRVEIIEAYANGSNDRLKSRINEKYYNETFNTND